MNGGFGRILVNNALLGGDGQFCLVHITSPRPGKDCYSCEIYGIHNLSKFKVQTAKLRIASYRPLKTKCDAVYIKLRGKTRPREVAVLNLGRFILDLLAN